ncbi:SDR family NAD(P)-dependent oxidoreductase [Siminovitchia sediminis]|uniref:SDR family NAD(P)-dependent oxidoreductase n=1 Tax=Siminovitchia sediminis TaxID=1274353 RepID=A0ABW4KFJ6_9BACI
MRLKDKVAIVTGGSQGIGEGIAHTFGQNGAKVVIADVNEELGMQVVSKFSEKGIDSLFVKTDVSREEDVKALIQAAVDRFGGIDLLINNAAVNVRKSAVDTSFEEWQKIIGVNLTGAFLCSKYAIPEMEKRGGGAIVNIASWHAEKTITRLAAYAASKGGMTALTRQMSLDCGPLNIRVNAVCPSTVDTPMLQQTFASLEDPDGAFEETLKFQPLGRIGTIDDIANACLFMCSDEASYISGQTLMVDGAAINKIARPLMFD